MQKIRFEVCFGSCYNLDNWEKLRQKITGAMGTDRRTFLYYTDHPASLFQAAFAQPLPWETAPFKKCPRGRNSNQRSEQRRHGLGDSAKVTQAPVTQQLTPHLWASPTPGQTAGNHSQEMKAQKSFGKQDKMWVEGQVKHLLNPQKAKTTALGIGSKK